MGDSLPIDQQAVNGEIIGALLPMERHNSVALFICFVDYRFCFQVQKGVNEYW